MARRWRNSSLICVSLVLTALIVAACSEEETGSITISASGTAELYSVTNQSTDIQFHTTSSWKASCEAKWLTFSPKNGEAGANTITLSTTATNRTGNPRVANLTIESGGTQKTVSVKQRDEYVIFDQKEFHLSAKDTVIVPTFRTNVDVNLMSAYASNGLMDWVKVEDEEKAKTREEKQYAFKNLRVPANTSKDARDGAIIIAMEDKTGQPLGLDTLFLYQEGADNDYQSVDYSQDGKVELLNKATEGKGIPIVLMGDGFIDQEIADSSYARTMRQAMENLFSEEPIKSLRDYFNVYQVTAVSPRNQFYGDDFTALGTIPDRQTTGITVNADRVMNYVKKVENIDSIHSLAVVILNSNLNKGVTYMIRDTKKNDYDYSIALCPVIDSLKSEKFRQVLTHEAIGHGFAKLADEYVRSIEGSATEKDIKLLQQLHKQWSWYLNVDSEKDSTKVLWSKFIFDSEFANEKIGTYEGGYTFFKGVYRPSEGSMMNQNDSPFNAPSRRAIYNKVMELGLGQHPSYEEFVAFDSQHKPEKWSYKARTRQIGWDTPWLPTPPKIIWR